MADRPDTKKRPSALLLLAGIAAMVVSVSALTRTNPLTVVDSVQIGWIAVAVAVVVGLALVVAPVIGRRHRDQ